MITRRVRGREAQPVTRSPVRRWIKERGQILPLMGVMAIGLFAIIGLSVDVGRMFVTKAALSRAVDAAALAGVQDLPDTSEATSKATEYLALNEPSAVPTIGADTVNSKLTVDATQSVSFYFLSIIGIDGATVSAHAVAGFGDVKLDLVLVMDDTGTMRNTCNGNGYTPSTQTNSTCPVKQARDGANALLDILPFGCGGCQTQVAIVPFRGCYSNHATNRYNPVPMASEGAPYNANPAYASRGCINQNDIMSLSGDRTALKNHIDTRLAAPGGYPGTNVCAGMYEGYQRLTGAGADADARKIMVILTDGDQRYSDGAQGNTRGNSPVPGVYDTAAWSSGQGTGGVPAQCRPGSPSYTTSAWSDNTDKRINTMDVGAYSYANSLKALGVEIYVLRFAVPAGDLPATTLCDPTLVGPANASTDRNNSNESRDQNFSRCLASSTAGTNDHYFYAAAPSDIPTMFTIIAQAIATRLIE